MKKKCKDCTIEMNAKIIRDVDSHNNLVEYTCENCGYRTTEIVPIGVLSI